MNNPTSHQRLVSLTAGLLIALVARGIRAQQPTQNAAGISFENRQQPSGVDFVLHNGTTVDKPIIDSIPGGVALLDYDNDGFLDIFFTNGARIPSLSKEDPNFYNRLYHNNHDGTFTDVTEKAGLSGTGYSIGVAAADVDNDGWPDLYVTGINLNILYRNNHDGTFTDVSESTGIADQIGKGMGVAVADYDADGWMDIFVANDNQRNFLFKNRRGKGLDEVGVEAGVAYTEDGIPVSSMGVDFRDYRNDGSPGIFITALGGETFPLYRNEGNDLFSMETYPANIGFSTYKMSGWGAGIVDLNNDGYKDLFSANSHVSENADIDPQQQYLQTNAIFENMKDNTFQDVSAHAGPGLSLRAAHRGAAFGDLNNDGKVDIVVSVIAGHAELLYNTTANGNHWLLIQTIGTKSNRDGIGTQIKLTSQSGSVQFNQVTTAGSYASSSDKRVHFGLGRDTLVKEITLRWPSGTVQTLHNVKADQILRVTEGTL